MAPPPPSLALSQQVLESELRDKESRIRECVYLEACCVAPTVRHSPFYCAGVVSRLPLTRSLELEVRALKADMRKHDASRHEHVSHATRLWCTQG